MRAITVFGSATCPPDSTDYQLAYEIGAAIGRLKLDLCNGGYGGAMEASARGAGEQGAKTTGITFADQASRAANAFIDNEVRVGSYWERVQQLLARGDAYIVLKGGTGTLAELALAAELMLKDFLPPKPLLVYEPFWGPAIDVLRRVSNIDDHTIPFVTAQAAAIILENAR